MLGKKKDNIKTHKQKKSMKEILNSIHRSIKSIHLWLFIVLMMFSIIPMFGMRWMIDYFYQQEFISNEVATVQTKAAAIAGEFNGYNTLAEAKAAGVYEQMVKFSNINSLI